MKKILILLLIIQHTMAWGSPHTLQALVTTDKQATLSSPMTGRVDAILIKEGDYVKKDALLIRFDCESLVAELAKTRAQRTMSEASLKAVSRLHRLQSASTMKLEEARASVAKARADVTIAEKNVSHCLLRAPFAAQVTEIAIRPHETVQLHQKMIRLLDNAHLHVEVLVPSHYISTLKKGQSFTLKVAESGKQYPVQIERIIDEVDAVSRSVKVIGQFKTKHPELKSGMSGEAKFNHDRNTENVSYP